MKTNTSFIQYSACLLLMAIMHHATQAQFAKGSFLIGGDGGYTSNQSTFRSTTTLTKSFSIGPKMGYFVVNRFAIGAGVGFSISESEIISINKYRNQVVNLLPFFRYYISNLYIQAQGGGGMMKIVNKSTAASKKYYASEFSIVAGYALFLTPVVALEAQAGYKAYSNKYGRSDPQYVNMKQSNFLVNVGLQFYLTRKE